MHKAGENTPLFIEAFWDACKSLQSKYQNCVVPDISIINKLLIKYQIGFELKPPELILRETDIPLIEVSERPPSLAEKAIEVFQKSLNQSEQFLNEKKGREAVQELLWLIETVSTAFRGIETANGAIEGKYFNKIAGELKKMETSATFSRIIEWMQELHGFLSSPTGGGVRHGLDLKDGIAISLSEARLICNLIRSYLGFLLTEHERLTRVQ